MQRAAYGHHGGTPHRTRPDTSHFLRAAFPIVLALAASLLLAACETHIGTAKVPPGQIHSVAIVSALPNQLTLNYIGITVFNNEHVVVPLDLGFNELILADIQRALAGHYQIVPLTIDKPVPDHASGVDEQMQSTSEKLRATVKPGTVDAIIIAAPFFGAARSGTDPLAAFWGTDPRSSRPIEAGVSWILEVFDGTTFERIGQSQTILEPTFDERWSGQPWDQISPDVKAKVEAALKRNLEGVILVKLKVAGLL